MSSGALAGVVMLSLIMQGVVAAQAQGEASASTRYHARYLIAGFLLRTAAVCGRDNERDTRRTIEAAFNLLNGPELEATSKGYPDTIRKWMEDGADDFNNGVVSAGVGPTCAYAMTVRGKTEEIAQAGH
jgi:hypothetical protein